MSGLKASDHFDYPKLILLSEDQSSFLSITQAVSSLHSVMKANQTRVVTSSCKGILENPTLTAVRWQYSREAFYGELLEGCLSEDSFTGKQSFFLFPSFINFLDTTLDGCNSRTIYKEI